MKKVEVFENELNYIKNERLRTSAGVLIEKLPNYFFEIPASSTGKYHPEYALGHGGLVRHTKAAVLIANDLLNINNTIGGYFTDIEKDLIIIALIIHDGLKSGYEKSQYTSVDHPLLISNFVSEHEETLQLEKEEINKLKSMLETHMGQWTTDYKGNEILAKPETNLQKFVHMCDYLASRKYLNVPFVYNEIKI